VESTHGEQKKELDRGSVELPLPNLDHGENRKNFYHNEE
jgi:hypothetical protein